MLMSVASHVWAEDLPSTGQQKIDATLAQCMGCHGAGVRSLDATIPSLAGQNLDYLMYQLQRFAALSPGAETEGNSEPPSPDRRDLANIRERRSAVMSEHTQGLDAATLREVARYYSTLPCGQTVTARTPPKPPVGAAWCADCHAPKKVKDLTNVPNLNGQPAEYLEGQLLAFKRANQPSTGTDEIRTHHFMGRSVRSLSDARLREIADYYSKLSCGS